MTIFYNTIFVVEALIYTFFTAWLVDDFGGDTQSWGGGILASVIGLLGIRAFSNNCSYANKVVCMIFTIMYAIFLVVFSLDFIFKKLHNLTELCKKNCKEKPKNILKAKGVLRGFVRIHQRDSVTTTYVTSENGSTIQSTVRKQDFCIRFGFAKPKPIYASDEREKSN